MSEKIVPSLHDFSSLLEKYQDKAYVKEGSKLLPVDISLRILDEYCATKGYSYSIDITNFDVTPLAHTVAVSLTLTENKKTNPVTTRVPGISCVFAQNYAELTKHGPTERATTSAIGKALAYLGIRYGSATRSLEEHEQWERANSDDIVPRVSKVAVLFSELPEKIRYEAKKQGIDVIRMSHVVDPDATTIGQLSEMILDKTLKDAILKEFGSGK